jgi:site-specific DNA recombinase
VRCAIYTRKSTEEGLDQAFNSLDAQREAAEAFIASQGHAGWVCLPERYDDGGFTGGNMDRPGLQRLLADIAAGRVDCVVTQRVDRLSRSLIDFARMMETFEKHRVSFVSVTQQFNTANSVGRLVLHILLSFAQFERELIAERTRDKIAATRRKGQWCGGQPLLGYDVTPHGARLVVNRREARRVQAIFELYLEHRGLLPVLRELRRRRWRNKRWLTRKGKVYGGGPFTKNSLVHLLTNVTYIGRVKHHRDSYPGEHSAIISPEVFEQVQQVLARNRRMRRGGKRSATRALLTGLLRCGGCGGAMTPTYASKPGRKRYHYYVCAGAEAKPATMLGGRVPRIARLMALAIHLDELICTGRCPIARPLPAWAA